MLIYCGLLCTKGVLLLFPVNKTGKNVISCAKTQKFVAFIVSI